MGAILFCGKEVDVMAGTAAAGTGTMFRSFLVPAVLLIVGMCFLM